MKKKLLWCAGIIVLSAVIILGVWRYIEDASGNNIALNTEALGMVIDFAKTENNRYCKVNEYRRCISKILPGIYIDGALHFATPPIHWSTKNNRYLQIRV